MGGHELHEEDLRLMYTFDQSSGSAAQYEAHSDAQVCVKFKHACATIPCHLYLCCKERNVKNIVYSITRS